jgi:hypothetical protein
MVLLKKPKMIFCFLIFKILGGFICFCRWITSLAVGLKFKSFLGLTRKNIKYFISNLIWLTKNKL